MKRRILLVDDEIAVLLTLKAVLEISGYDVDTANSAREGKSRLKSRRYDMVITDMRMESDQAGREVIVAARTAPYHPAVALLTAYPVEGNEAQEMGADKMLVKPMQTRALIQSIEKLLTSHEAKLRKLESEGPGAGLAVGFAAGLAAANASGSALSTRDASGNVLRKAPAKSATVKGAKGAAKKSPGKKAPGKKAPGKKAPGKKAPGKKTPGKKTAGKKTPGVTMPRERALPAPARRALVPGRPTPLLGS